jgi:hypothetical protein
MKLELLDALYGSTHGYRTWACLNGRLRRLMPRKDTQICIEGYPRCGNTFGVLAFQKAQRREVRVSHHLHAESQVRWACAQRIPVILLLRDPADAIASLVLRHPEYTLERAAARYVKFHSAVAGLKDRLVVSRFESTVAGLASATRAVNDRFGTDFDIPVDIRDEEIFDEIDRLNQASESGNLAQIARPEAAKARPLLELKERLHSSPSLPQARDLWNQLLAVSV